jgi:prepilin-type N-terminal cleavage/methylation domain-containing protein
MSHFQRQKKTARRTAFTLVELLVVMSIILILAAILVPAVQSIRQRSLSSNTKALVKKIEVILEDVYGGDWDDATWIPDLSGGYSTIGVDNLGQKQSELSLEEIQNLEVVDYWGTPLRICQNGNNAPGLDIWSAGPDEEFRTDDDIVNWTREGSW